jgi:hypothetical protein
MRLSALEHLLVASAREQFGEPLTQFLLAGLGDDEPAQGQLFTIEFIENGTALRREVKVSTSEHSDGSIRLPQRREPLIILALLQLLIAHDQTSTVSLSYHLEEVLEILGWKDTARSRRIIDETIERYSTLMYSWKMSSDELAFRKLSFYNSRECFVSGFSCIDEGSKDGKHLTRITNRIDFNKEFVESIKQRSLFKIEWNSVKSITHTPVRSV